MRSAVFSATWVILAAAGVLASSHAAEVASRYSVDPAAPVDPVIGMKVPAGFRATVFAEVDGYARHMAVRDDGTVYLALTVRMGRGTNMGVVALQDRDGDGAAEVAERFATDIPGTEVLFHDGYLYFGSKTAIYRFGFEGAELVPSGEPELVVGGFPEQRLHDDKTFAIDEQGNLYVNVGAPSNACEVEFRTRGSPGKTPCEELERQAGIWRFAADRTGQMQEGGHRYATGVRNAVAIEWNPADRQLYFLSHGRDTLFLTYPEHYTAEQSAELPAEEMHVGVDGGDYGWPFTYYDHIRQQRLLAPEYGGDGTELAEAGKYREPIAAFPGHWAPNDLLFYSGEQFPEHFQGGAFVVFHGSWNRAPLPQAGYKVAYVPFQNGRPSSDWEVFADGFKGVDTLENPADAARRPEGIAQGVDGELYISESNGRVWRVDYVGR
jgi:glucose/arabinose dehydrogenase